MARACVQRLDDAALTAIMRRMSSRAAEASTRAATPASAGLRMLAGGVVLGGFEGSLRDPDRATEASDRDRGPVVCRQFGFPPAISVVSRRSRKGDNPVRN